jgi:hypothetical protein
MRPVHAEAIFDRMERFTRIVPALAAGLSPDDAHWRPPEGGWSIVEIVAHLADEETEDFRTRVELTLRDPSASWPRIDPEGWAVSRHYNDRDLDAEVTRFVAARRESLTWLRRLDSPDWSSAHVHPKIGPLRAGDLLAAWSAHDALHLRQIAKRLWQMTRRDAGAHEVAYAGAWTA